MDDNNGCGCFLILAAIGFIAWIGMTASKNSSGSSSNTTPATFSKNSFYLLPEQVRLGLFFNELCNYSGGFLIAHCARKKCTARCSQRVAQRFSDVCTL